MVAVLHLEEVFGLSFVTRRSTDFDSALASHASFRLYVFEAKSRRKELCACAKSMEKSSDWRRLNWVEFLRPFMYPCLERCLVGEDSVRMLTSYLRIA